MKDFEREIELLRSFSYALDLPVRLLSEGETVFSMPEKICTAADAGGNEALSSFSLEGGSSAQYIQTAAWEKFIVMRLDESVTVAVGPFLVEKPSENLVTAMARTGMIKLQCKNAVLSYYESLPMVSRQRFFYAGKLLEIMFSSGRGVDARMETAESSYAFIQPEYYRQAKDYRTQQFRHSPYMMEQEICRMISNGDTQGAHRILKEINSRPRARLAGSDIRSLKNSVICSCSFMTRAAISGGVSPDEAFTLSDTYIQLVENCSDPSDIINYEDEMVNGFTNAVNNAKNSRFSQAVSQSLSFIDAHLCEPISVQKVAEAVYLSPNYLSGLFLRETGETIHSCIIRRRIEEASFFVRNSSDSFADIASFYQFSSQSHFVQSFKRIMGVTPGVYRKTNLLK